MERGVAAGHLRLAEDGEEVTDVHPMILVVQGQKMRACQDYSTGLNQKTPSAPFSLPRPFDVREHAKPGSYLAKMDMRDGFWAVPIHKDKHKHFGLRHPVTGKVHIAQTLPFGWARSPQFFCAVTEATCKEPSSLASETRRMPSFATGSADLPAAACKQCH